MSELRNDWRLPDPPDLSGWHDVGRIVNGINPALPDLDPRITLSAQLRTDESSSPTMRSI